MRKTGRWHLPIRFPRRRVGTRKPEKVKGYFLESKPSDLEFFSFPRAGVGMNSRRASVAVCENGTLAPPDSVPTPARGNQKKLRDISWSPNLQIWNFSRSHAPASRYAKTGRWHLPIRFPRRREPEKNGTLALPNSVPTPARGNQKNRKLTI